MVGNKGPAGDAHRPAWTRALTGPRRARSPGGWQACAGSRITADCIKIPPGPRDQAPEGSTGTKGPAADEALLAEARRRAPARAGLRFVGRLQ